MPPLVPPPEATTLMTVGALGDQHPDLAADLVGRVGDAAGPVDVPATVGDRPAGQLQARPGK